MKYLYEANGVWVYEITVRGASGMAIVVRTPNEKADILQIKCQNGMLLCRAFDKDVMERIDFPVAIFSAIDCEAMLAKKPLYVSPKAVELGANLEMTGEQLFLLFA